MNRPTLKQIEAELSESLYTVSTRKTERGWNVYEVQDADGQRISYGAERRFVLETAYQWLQEEKEAQSNQPSSGEFVEIPKRCSVCGKSLKEVGNLSLWKGELYCSYNCLNEKSDKEQPALVEVPDILAENRKRIELLEAQVAKLQGDLEAAGNIIIKAGEQVEKKSRSLLDKIEENVSLREFIRAIADSGMPTTIENQALLFRATVHDAQVFLANKQPASKEAPATKPIASRMHVNWSGRGFSSGTYEVLEHSASKQAYVLNISTDPAKPMPKWVKAADCQA